MFDKFAFICTNLQKLRCGGGGGIYPIVLSIVELLP